MPLRGHPLGVSRLAARLQVLTPSALLLAPLLLGGCAALGKAMSPYSETFACKNSDHGLCIDPAEAHADAVAGMPSRSDPAVTRGKRLAARTLASARRGTRATESFAGYQDSVYRELQGLIDAPETPMLRQGRTIRTLILPYATSARADRLYMPRFVYSILERPQWVVGDYLVRQADPGAGVPVLGQVREQAPSATGDDPGDRDHGPVPATPVLP